MVVRRVTIADDVAEFEFAPAEGTFPAWAPGAHIDVHLADGLVRQYSLCGDPAQGTAGGSPCAGSALAAAGRRMPMNGSLLVTSCG